MGKEVDYRCSECNHPTPRRGLVAKKVTFAEMGAGGRHFRSRIVAWLCATCLERDEHYNLPKNAGPYMRETHEQSV